jgi:hypothetical protein
MAEYIKRTDVMKICEGYSEHCFNSNDSKGQDIADRILDDVVEIPTADVVEVKHGEWKHTVEKGNVYNHHFFNCSLCGASAFTSGYEKYCHECGAKMDERRDT